MQRMIARRPASAKLTRTTPWLEGLIFLGLAALVFVPLGARMGVTNMLNTMMNTAYDLLMNTVLYLMAIAVLAGALSGLLVEFGVVALFHRLLSPLMMPVYGLPGASVVGVFATYFSDNPAILTLANDRGFCRYFKRYQLPALTNLGTAYGMGLVITTFMAGLSSPSGESFVLPALIGNVGAVIGSVVSVRLMLCFSKRLYGTAEPFPEPSDAEYAPPKERTKGIGNRFISALLTGGKNGVDMGLAIIPGVLIICTFVMMLTNGPSADGTYTGAAYEGVGLLPLVGERLQFLLSPLFGFSSPEAVTVPITSLGSAGAAIGLIPKMVSEGRAHGNDIAVFTAICMCWSGYLSTHVAMMDNLKCGELTGKAIISHTIGGLAAGISAHWIYWLLSALFRL